MTPRYQNIVLIPERLTRTNCGERGEELPIVSYLGSAEC